VGLLLFNVFRGSAVYAFPKPTLPQKLWQLRDIRSNAPRLIAGK
jgi:hypothetical protein